MDGATIIYSSNGLIDAGTSEINIGKHTSAIYFMNTSATAIIITLNSTFKVYIPGTPSTNWAAEYYCIEGDYTRFQSNSTNSTLSVYAVA